MSILFRNIKLITPYRILHGYGVVVDEGKITNIDSEKNINTESINKIIDGKGQYLSPGFIDIHNHGNSGCDFMDAAEETIDNISKFHMKNGVTSFLGTIITGSYENMINAATNMAEHKSSYSQLLGIHLEGPFFSLSKKGAQPEEYIKETDISFIERMIDICGSK